MDVNPEVEALFLNADMTAQDPWVAMSRMGLQLVQEITDTLAT